jgi:RNA polymerase sigma-70 factor (ECF subfamily)
MIETAELETHRAALTGHCYRMLGSPADADDAVQETMIRAWKGREGFDGRSSPRTWLTRIATNVCLDLLRERGGRARPLEDGPAGTIHDELKTKPRSHWLEPIPDVKALDPAERAERKQSIRLAFVSALQKLPPKPRAALLLSDVLGWSAAEVAESLELSVPAVNSALQRARATVPSTPSAPSEEEERIAERYAEAFERYDMDALAALLREDAILNMPPFTLWLWGVENVKAWMLGRGAGCRGSKLVRVRANGVPAFAQYKADGSPWSLFLLEVEGGKVVTQTFFLDCQNLYPYFDLPMTSPR